MTIEENLERIAQAKVDIQNSIIAKGVDINPNTQIDGFSTYINEIPAGLNPSIDKFDNNWVRLNEFKRTDYMFCYVSDIEYAYTDNHLEILNESFNSMSSLRYMELGENVHTITNSLSDVFHVKNAYGNLYPSRLIVGNPNPPLVTGNFLKKNEGLKIYVPTESVDYYKNAYGWKDYSDQIYAYEPWCKIVRFEVENAPINLKWLMGNGSVIETDSYANPKFKWTPENCAYLVIENAVRYYTNIEINGVTYGFDERIPISAIDGHVVKIVK